LGVLWRLAGAPQPDTLLRPPGARAGAGFLAACIRCGQCVEACPYDTLHLADLSAGLGAGAPYLVARDVPCFLCADYDELLCIAACPTTALQQVETEDIAMGVAVLDQQTCLAYNDVVCRACWHACPFPGSAIEFDAKLRPVVRADACIGCGLCEHACLADPAAIAVRPAALGLEASS